MIFFHSNSNNCAIINVNCIDVNRYAPQEATQGDFTAAPWAKLAARPPPPHPEDEVPGEALGGVRSRPAAALGEAVLRLTPSAQALLARKARQPDAVGQRRGNRRVAGDTADDAGRSGALLGHRDRNRGHDPVGLPSAAAPDRRAAWLVAGSHGHRTAGSRSRHGTLPGQRAEVAILNRMIDQARPNSVRCRLIEGRVRLGCVRVDLPAPTPI